MLKSFTHAEINYMFGIWIVSVPSHNSVALS